MKLGKNLRKVKIRRRIYSVVLSIMMIANLMYGYTWTTDTSAVKSKKAEVTQTPYINVLYYGDIDSLVSKYKLKKYWDDVEKANYF